MGRTEKIRTGLFLFSPPDREHDRCIFPLLALQLQGKGRSSGRRKDCPYLGDGGNVDSVARNALKKANRKLIDGVLPYRLNEKKIFSMGYLSGFVAENRDMEKDGFVNEVKEEVRQFALSSLSSQTGNYSSVQVRKNQADITEETWAAALLPVWTVTYNDKARGKIYYFALNGQTGKIWGELPVDNKKLAVLFLSIFVPVCVILLFLGYWIG